MAQQEAWLLGIGLDGDDGHQRVTRGKNLVLWGGSAETHERMQDHVIRVQEELDRRGKQVNDCSTEELQELIREASERN